jgi:hypothetical protein
MRRKITLLIALVLSMTILLLTGSDSAVRAEPPQRYQWDTGLITVGQGQTLRIAATGFDPGPLDGKFINFRRISYTQTTCSGGVCKQAISGQTVSEPIILAPNEAAVIDCEGYAFCRVVVSGNSPKVRVNVMILNSVTGEVEAVQMSLQRENQ